MDINEYFRELHQFLQNEKDIVIEKGSGSQSLIYSFSASLIPSNSEASLLNVDYERDLPTDAYILSAPPYISALLLEKGRPLAVKRHVTSAFYNNSDEERRYVLQIGQYIEDVIISPHSFYIPLDGVYPILNFLLGFELITLSGDSVKDLYIIQCTMDSVISMLNMLPIAFYLGNKKLIYTMGKMVVEENFVSLK